MVLVCETSYKKEEGTNGGGFHQSKAGPGASDGAPVGRALRDGGQSATVEVVLCPLPLRLCPAQPSPLFRSPHPPRNPTVRFFFWCSSRSIASRSRSWLPASTPRSWLRWGSSQS